MSKSKSKDLNTIMSELTVLAHGERVVVDEAIKTSLRENMKSGKGYSVCLLS